MRRMRWYYKLAAIVGGLVIGFIVISAVVGAVVGLVFGLLIKLVIAALVVGGIALAIQRARSRRQVSGRRAEREIREPGHREYSMPPPRADADPVPEAPVRETRRVDVEDDLARLKREMGSLALPGRPGELAHRGLGAVHPDPGRGPASHHPQGELGRAADHGHRR